ncbi:hypothetical protein [uncultured Tateyamaria sp.]|uniref:hypothetical protein n=1 Tax=Tateyamaria sp. 1078 TaxID=3417464 RepID=UPI00261A503E|nr:hypothetical protein [uncultured Tateyamaria sp.]
MRLTRITPFEPSASPEAQAGFYRDSLGFEVEIRADNSAVLQRDDAAIHLVEASDHAGLTHPERKGSFCIGFDGEHELYPVLKPKVDILPDRHVRAPFNQDCGPPEFHRADDDCTPLVLGEAI